MPRVTSPQIAISIPQLVPDGAFDPAALRRYLSRAEELGFDGAWTTEQVIGTAPNLDSSAVLGYAAACTEQIRLGCAVYVSTVASPLHLAKITASLDQLSRGRLEVGLSTGGRFRPFAAFGIDGEGFVSRFTEGVLYMQAAWTHDRINFEGRFWQAKGLAMEPKPYQKPHPPLWLGGGHPETGLKRSEQLQGGLVVVSSVGPLCGWLAARHMVLAKSVLPRGWVPLALTR